MNKNKRIKELDELVREQRETLDTARNAVSVVDTINKSLMNNNYLLSVALFNALRTMGRIDCTGLGVDLNIKAKP